MVWLVFIRYIDIDYYFKYVFVRDVYILDLMYVCLFWKCLVVEIKGEWFKYFFCSYVV